MLGIRDSLVDQYLKLIALDDEQVAEYKENGEVYGDGVNDYLTITIDGKDFYKFKATLLNNYCETLELVRYIIREEDTSFTQSNGLFYDWNKNLAAGKINELTVSKQDDKKYVYEWYYMYDGKLCKKSSADVVDTPKFFQNNLGYALNGDNVELIGSTKDLPLAIIPKTVEWSGKSYPVNKVNEDAFESRNDLKAIVDLNGNVKAETLKATAPIYVADAKGNGKLKEFVTWGENKFMYSGKTHKPAWTNNLSEFGITATSDAQTSKKDVGEYTEEVPFTFSYQKQTFEEQLPCTYTITPAPLAAEVQNAQRTYGAENPKFEVKYTGFVNGETDAVVTIAGKFATDATVKSPVGEYDITLTGVEAKNYEVTTKPGKLTIGAAKITAKVNSTERIYGDENPQMTLTLTGLLNGDKQEDVLTSAGTFTTDATKTSSVGEYAVKCTGVKAKNYEVETVDGVLKVTPAKLTAKANNATRKYGAANPDFTISYTGFRNGDTESVLTSKGTCSAKATARSEVGDYEIAVKGAKAQNYTFEYEPGTLTVTKAPLTAEVQNVQRAYGADNPQFTAKYTGFVNGETEAVLTNKGTFATEATKDSPAGEYAITLTGVEAKNYEVTTFAGKLIIGTAKLTAKVNNAERIYGDENPAFTYTLTGLVNGDTESVLTDKGQFLTTATKASDVGQYTVVCDGIEAKNYDVEVVPGTLTIEKATLIGRVNTASKVYGEENPKFTARYIGFRNGEDAKVLTSQGKFATKATAKSDVGEYEVTMSGAEAKNYTFEYEPGTLTISKALLTAEVQNVQRAYGAENPQFTAKYTGFVNGDTEAVLTSKGTFATEATKESPAGEYAITLSGVEAKNYEVTTFAGKLIIGTAKLTIKVNDAERVYGDENPAFTYTVTGLANGDKQEDVLTDKGQFLTTATKTSDVGQYTVVCDGIEAKNYDVEVVPGTLTIEKATLMGRVNAASKVYGEENPQFTARFVGFRNGEDAKVLTSQGTFATKATAKSEVGEYEVTLSSAEAKNYTFEYEPGTLTISKAPLTAEVQNMQRAYGADNPQFTAKYTGFVNGDTEAVLTNKGTFATEATKESPAGEYAITLAGVEAKNYAVTTIAGKLTVAIAKLTVKVNNAERVYGDENPEFTYTLTGLLNGDRQEDVLTSVGTFTTEATKMSAVGEYAVKCTGVKARNYEVEAVDGVLRVTPAQIIVRVNNAKRPYGEDNPQFTARYIGFRNSETDNVLKNKGVFITAATKTSDVGEYEITATNAQAKNYTFEYEPGTLTIEQTEQQIVWNQELGDIAQFKQIELTATATSGLAVSYQVTQGSEVCSVVKVGKTTFLDCFGTGDVTVSAWQEGDKNYYPTLRTYKQVKVVPTGIGNAEAGDYTVTAKRGQLLIGGLRDGDTVLVTDLAGRTVYSGEEPVVNVARGSYVVRIGRQTWKVLVR